MQTVFFRPSAKTVQYSGQLSTHHSGTRRYEIAGDAEEAAEAGAQSRQQRRPGLVPRFHVLLTTFELASKVDLDRTNTI